MHERTDGLIEDHRIAQEDAFFENLCNKYGWILPLLSLMVVATVIAEKYFPEQFYGTIKSLFGQ